ncbi:MAG: SRPBCC family protein [Myxococcota bacterium]
MTDVTIAETVVLPVDIEDAYDFLLTPKAFQLFTGWGPIPGIRDLDWKIGSSAEEGSEARVHNTDGSSHRERVTVATRPHRYEVAIDEFSSAFRFLTEGATETWDLSPTEKGTRIERAFVFRLRSAALLPLGWAIGAMFRKAVQANHAAMVEWANASDPEG